MNASPVGWFKYTSEKNWFVRDSRSSPYVRTIQGVEQRFNPSPELDKWEAVHGRVDTSKITKDIE